MAKGKAFAPVGSVLQSLAHRFGLEAKLLESHLQQHWREVAGEHMAAHTWPDRIRFKKLYLIVESSVWAQQLTFLKPALIQTINAKVVGPVHTDIVARVGELSKVSSEREKGKGEGERSEDTLEAEVLREAVSHAHHVSDPDLRTRLTEVMAKALAVQERRARSRPTRRRVSAPPRPGPPTSRFP